MYLKDCWRSVSVRSVIDADGSVDKAEDVVKEVDCVGASSLLTKLDLSEVDVYNMYSHSELLETRGSEVEEECMYKDGKQKNGSETH